MTSPSTSKYEPEVQDSSRFDPETDEIEPQVLDLGFMNKKAWLAKNFDLPENPFGMVHTRGMKEYLFNQRRINFQEDDDYKVPLDYKHLVLDCAIIPPRPPIRVSGDVLFDLRTVSYHYVTTGPEFLNMMTELDSEETTEIYVDLEKTNSNCYQKEAVVLIQLSTVRNNYVIDPLSLTDHIKNNLKRVFENPLKYKIFHDYNGDVKALLAQFKIFTQGILDSARLHQKIFPKDYDISSKGKLILNNKSLLYLVQKFLSKGNDKTLLYFEQLKNLFKPVNWVIRPLQAALKHYAVGDTYLLMLVVNEWKKMYSNETKRDFQNIWFQVHNEINAELTNRKSKVSFFPLQDPQITSFTVQQEIDRATKKLRAQKFQVPKIDAALEHLEDIFHHRLYLAKVMDEKPETILRVPDLIKIMILKPTSIDNISEILSDEAKNYPCTLYWGRILLRYLREGRFVFSDIESTVCHKCGESNHPARFCFKVIESGPRFYEENPEYQRVKTQITNSRKTATAKLRKLFPSLVVAVEALLKTLKVQQQERRNQNEAFIKFMGDVTKLKVVIADVKDIGDEMAQPSWKKLKKNDLSAVWRTRMENYNEKVNVIKASARNTFQHLRTKDLEKVIEVTVEIEKANEEYLAKPQEPLPMKESKEVDRQPYAKRAQEYLQQLKENCKTFNFDSSPMAKKLYFSLKTLSHLSLLCVTEKIGPKRGMEARNEKLVQLYDYIKLVPNDIASSMTSEEASEVQKAYDDLESHFIRLFSSIYGVTSSTVNPIVIPTQDKTDIIFGQRFANFGQLKALLTAIRNPFINHQELAGQINNIKENLELSHALMTLLGAIEINEIMVQEITEVKDKAVKGLRDLLGEINVIEQQQQPTKERLLVLKNCRINIQNVMNGVVSSSEQSGAQIKENFKETEVTMTFHLKWFAEIVRELDTKIRQMQDILKTIAKRIGTREDFDKIKGHNNSQINLVYSLYVLSSSCAHERGGLLKIAIMRFRTAVRAVKQTEKLLDEIKTIEGQNSKPAKICQQILEILRNYVFFRDYIEGNQNINYLSACLGTEVI